jgi:hypothetical protein
MYVRVALQAADGALNSGARQKNDDDANDDVEHSITTAKEPGRLQSYELARTSSKPMNLVSLSFAMFHD